MAAGQIARRRESDKREEILRAAAEQFMRLGYAATSIDAVAEKLGATKGRIYHYYRSKSEIYFDVQRMAMTCLFETVEPLARETGPAKLRLRAMAMAHLDLLLREMPIQKVAVQGLEQNLFEAEGFRHAKALAEVNRLRDDYEEMFAEVIADGVREGDFIDQRPRLLTKPFFGTLNWVTTWYRPRRRTTDADIEAICETLVDFAMRGIQT